MTSFRSALILGGARSGKSRFAQVTAESAAERRVFVATAQAFDEEMRERIARHQAERDAHWCTREAHLDLTEAIDSETGSDCAVLVDCLTLWLSNLMLAERDPERQTERLVEFDPRRSRPARSGIERGRARDRPRNVTRAPVP